MTNTDTLTSNKKRKYSLYVLIMASALFNVGCMKEINKNNSVLEARDSYYRGDFGRSFRLTEALAYQGDPKAEYTLGYMYYYGIGAPANKALGKAWIRRSAEQGFPPAMAAAMQINVCDSSIKPKRVKRCIDSSREIAPFDQPEPYQSQSELTNTPHKMALAPRLDAEIVPVEEVAQVAPIKQNPKETTVAEVVKEAEVIPAKTVPSVTNEAVLITDEMNTALQAASGIKEPFIQLAMLDIVANATSSNEPVQEQKSWVVQVGTFKNPKNAQALVNKLKTAGISAFTRTSKSKDTEFTLVMVGPHTKKVHANQVCASLAETFKLQGIILRDNTVTETNEQVMVSYLSFVDTL